MKKWNVHICYLLISTIITAQLLQHILDPGDQTWFAEQAKLYHYDYIKFALDRYQTWSSRLLIESATMFFSSHYLAFKVSLFGLTYASFYVIKSIFDRYRFSYFSLIVPVLFLYLFPTEIFTGAGIIATVTNYYFPMVTFVIAYYFYLKKDALSLILALLFFMFAWMSEQFAILGFGLFVYLLVSSFIKNHFVKIKDIFFLAINFLFLLSAKLAPGNANRVIQETNNWYPEFKDLSPLTKLIKGTADTNLKLFFTDDLNVMLLVLIILTAILSIKKKVIPYILSILLTMVIIVLHYNASFGQALSEFQLVIMGSLLITVIIYLLYHVSSSLEVFFGIVYLFGLGYGIRLLVSFSPTIYASGIRTFIPFIFTSLVAIIILVQDFLRNEVRSKGGNDSKLI